MFSRNRNTPKDMQLLDKTSYYVHCSLEALVSVLYRSIIDFSDIVCTVPVLYCIRIGFATGSLEHATSILTSVFSF